MPEQAAPAGAAPDRAGELRRSTRRRPAVLALLIVAGAAAMVVAGSMTWWRQQHLDALAGAVISTATGSQTDALLVPAALVGLAGFGAAVATTGTVRRLVGLLLLIGGGVAAVLAITGAISAPARLLTSLSRPPESSSTPSLQLAGVVLGTLGGLLLAAAGGLLVLGYGARRALGSRYDAPAGRRVKAAEPTPSSPAGDAADPAADADASAQWWKALDAGLDPTDGASDAARRASSNSPGSPDAELSGDAPRGG
jgi:uncharacterized membrane protein (TIGR02234 family)